MSPSIPPDLLTSLGGINPRRVRLDLSPGRATQADLIAQNDQKRGIYELIDGMIVEKASDFRGSVLGVAVLCQLLDFVRPRNLGLVTGPTGLLLLAPGLIRSPNVAFIAWDHIPGGRLPTEPIPAIAPTLAVEVLFPGNTRGEMARKRREYFQAGVPLVWEVNPENRTVSVYLGPKDSTVFDEGDMLNGGTVLPGFEFNVGDIFAELDRVRGR